MFVRSNNECGVFNLRDVINSLKGTVNNHTEILNNHLSVINSQSDALNWHNTGMNANITNWVGLNVTISNVFITILLNITSY